MTVRYPKLTKKQALGGEEIPSPEGWIQRIYQTNLGSFRFEKDTLEISADIFVEEIRLIEGSLRVNGLLADGRLQIGVFESEEYRLLGFGGSPQISTISFSGSRWDAVANAPSKGITLNVGADAAEMIVPAEKRAALTNLMNKNGAAEAVVLPVFAEMELLANAMQSLTSMGGNIEGAQVDIEEIGSVKEDLVGLASTVIDRVLDDVFIEPLNDGGNRRAIAYEIEDLLWKEPSPCSPELSLDYIAARMNCSRRTVQMAMSETFNMGFVPLKRLIRLHQANKTLLSTSERHAITDLAYQYEFMNPSRFSGFYKAMFGSQPRSRRGGGNSIK